MGDDERIRALVEKWARAEVAGDVDALAALTADTFTVVGPVGFVLAKTQWLDRHRSGALDVERLTVEELSVRDYGGVVVAIGRHAQRMSFQGRPAEQEFRVTHIAGWHEDGWLLVGQHLSAIQAPGAGRG
ncbi:nuclear transport factor 2 family protein [Actinokineospora sp. NBRC 105648]|uniref:nuclear transport factor 2 family protein n=1 Tax=Actinokineospora sp. NBRC 105648 TaxID=3032206 RepID=UPI002552DDA8|nr:nuclear transport factor 2 family protein [Actinokineospora sp. NBRC 105648]